MSRHLQDRTKVVAAARYLIWLASREPEPELVSHLRLQKLLYYVQGWHLGVFGAPLFQNRIEAWEHGPVVRDIYDKFATFRADPIPASEAQDPAALTLEEKAIVRSIWERYKRYSATELRRMTHREDPWEDAWSARKPGQSDAEIPHSAMRAFFREEFRKTQIPGLEPEAMREAEAELRAGRGVRLSELVADPDA